MTERQESPFWRFSLSLYRQDRVAPACLTLQDMSGVDVNVMLYGMWLAARGRALEAADMAAIDRAVRNWRKDVVVPLRNVRWIMKEPEAAFATPEAAALRDRIKGVELEAERLQQEALYRLRPLQSWGRAEKDVAAAAASNLDAYAEALGARFDPGAKAAMLHGLAALAASGRLNEVAGHGSGP